MIQIYICPGFHPPALTRSFLAALINDRPVSWSWSSCGVMPPHLPPYSPYHVLQSLRQHLEHLDHLDQLQPISPPEQNHPQPFSLDPPAIVWIGFSAGVVGALGAAQQWQAQGHPVLGLIAVDSWGLPLRADFPIYSLSRDGAKPPHPFMEEWITRYFMPDLPHFYAEPPVDHLCLWGSPDQVQGWSQDYSGLRHRTTAIRFILDCLEALVAKRYTLKGGNRSQPCH